LPESKTFTKTEVENVMKFYFSLVEMIIETGVKNRQLKNEIQKEVALDEELYALNEQMQTEVVEKSAVEEELRAANEQLTDEIRIRAAAQKKTEESEVKFRKFFQQIPNPLCHVDKDGKIIEINQSFYETFGYTTDDIPTLDYWWKLAFPDKSYRKRVIKTWDKAVEEATLKNVKMNPATYTVTGKSGEQRKMIIGGITIGNDFLATFHDITKRDAYERELLASRNFAQVIIESLPGIFYMFNSKGVLVRWNKNFTEITGFTDEEMKGKSPINFFRDDDTIHISEQVARVFAEGSGYARATLYTRQGVGIPFVFTGKLLKTESENYLVGHGTDISDLNKAQSELEESENLLKVLLNATRDTIALIDKEGRIIKINVDGAKRFNKTMDEIVGKNVYSLLPAKLAGSRKKQIDGVFNSGKPALFEDVRNNCHYENKIYPIFDDDGKVSKVGIFAIDISEKKKFEQKLRESEKKFHSLYDNAPDMYVSVSADSATIIECNNTLLGHTGYKRSEIIGSKIFKLYDESCLNEVESTFAQFKETGTVKNKELTLRKKDGSPIDVSLNVESIKDKDGNIQYSVSSWRDITETKIIQSELLKSKEKLQLITDQIPVLISYLTPDYKFEFVNKGYEDWFGLEAKDIIGKHAADIIGEEAFKITKPNLDRVFTGETINNERMIPYQHGGARYTQATFLPHRVSGKIAGAIVCVNDVTPMKDAENELRKLLDELERSNQELEQFAYVASHDLQEPLRMVSSFLQLLELRYSDKVGADGKEFIHYAVDGANRMKALINDLLKYSRVGTRGKPFEPTEMYVVMDQVFTNLSNSIKESKAIIKMDEMPVIDADQTQMVQLFQNLVGNAIKFRGNRQPEISIRVNQTQHEVTISVIDNGIGIDMKFIDKIFDVFQRLHKRNDYPGTGIGLAICKKIVERHRGTIEVKSKPGIGSTFKITIPKDLNIG